jgi:hypothetical protein
MTLHERLSETHAAMVELYKRPEFAHIRGEIAETIALLQQSMDLEKERDAA